MDDLFVIHCTTCRTRLRVREASAIGQILACPQCSSMVLVEPPAGFQLEQIAPTRAAAPAAPVAESHSSLRETIGEGDFGDVDHLFHGSTPRPAAAPQPANVAAAPNANPTPTAATTSEQPIHSPAPATEPTATVPTRTPANWTPPAVRRMRIVATVIGTSLMGIAFAIGFAFMVPRGSRPKVDEKAAPSIADAKTKLPDVANEKLEEPKTDVPAEPSPPSDKLDTPTAPPVVEPPVAIAKTDPPDTQPKGSEPAAKTNEPVIDPVPVTVNDKPDDDPLKLNELRKIAGMLGPENTNPDLSSEVAPAAVGDTPPSNVRVRPEMKKVDIAARLADKITEIEFEDRPLIDFLQVLSDYSTVPITLDPQSLAWSRIGPRQPVKGHLKQMAVVDVLRETLKPFRLEPIQRDYDVVISRSVAPRTIRYPVADLTGGDAQQQADLMEMVTSLAAPDSWAKSVGSGQITAQGELLVIENTELVHAQVVELLEKLRVARGLPIKSTFPKEMFSLTRRARQISPQLDAPLTLNYNRPTSLVKMLQRWADDAKVEFVFDWQALAEAGWSTDADATISLDKTPLRTALDQVLGPMELTYRAVGSNLLQITSPAAVAKNRELEFHPVAEVAKSAEELAKLLERLPAGWDAEFVARYDLPSKTLIVLASQPRQEEFARLLEEWKTSDK